VEISLLLGVGGRILTRQNAHEADVVGAIAQDLESLHEPREPVTLDAELLLDLGRRLGRAWIFDGRRRLDRRRFQRRCRVPLGRGLVGWSRRFARRIV
jgi:hypothetical protein